jgi:hypothetical protein
MATQIQLRRDTAANWTSTNPTMAQGEAGYETDTGKLKVGDGTTAWNSLAYQAAANIVDGTIVNADVNASAAIAGTKISPDFGSQTVQTTGIFSHALGTATAPTVTFTGDTNTGIYSPGADQLAISTNGVGRLFVDANGNVGVGNNSPSSVTSGGANLTLASNNGSITESVGIGSLSFKTVDASFTGAFADGIGAEIASTGFGAVGAAYNLAFITSTTTNSNRGTRMLIDALGRIGIGTTSPAVLLDCQRSGSSAEILLTRTDAATAGSLSVLSGGAVNSITSAGVKALTFSTDSTERMRLDSTGRLGLGTSSPDALLTVNGVGAFGAGTAALPSIARSSDLDTGAWFPAANTIAASTAGVERLRIDSTGRVGIGTTSPSARLDVNGDGGTALPTIFAGTAGIVSRTAATNNFCGFSIVAGTGATSSLNFGDADDEDRGAVQYLHSDDALRFLTSANERARIDSSGRLLVGTSSASSAGAYAQYGLFKIQGNSASSGGSAIINIARGEAATSITSGEDIGAISFTDSSGNEFGTIVCAADANAGAGDYPSRLVFSTTADGASSPTERMRITNNGRIFAGATGTYTSRFNVLGESGENVCSFANPGTGGIANFFANSTTEVGFISVSASATTYSTSSDYRLKENIVPLTGAVDRLQQIPVHRFNFIADPGTTVDGFIAHEAQAVVPECVTGTKDEVDEDGNPVYQGIDQSKLVPLLTAALQEALQKIEDLEGRLTAAGL